MFSATIVGRLGGDPESKTTAGGTEVVSFTLATDHGFGEKKKTTWTRVTVFGKPAEFVRNNLRKGDRAAVAGDVHLDEWEGRDGKRVTLCCDARSIEKLWDKKEGGSDAPSGSRRDPPRDTGRGGGGYDGPPPPPDDGIPFVRACSPWDRV